MFKRIWQWLKRFLERLLGTSPQRSSPKRRNQISPQKEVKSPPPLSDTDLESLFSQLLEGVNQGRGQEWAQKWLRNIEHRITTERWVEWLRRFGSILLASPVPNNELAARMVQLGELGIGEVGDVAYEIGMQLLTRNPGEPVWEYDGPDAEPATPDNQEGQEGEPQAISLDELFGILQQDANLVQQLAQQLGIETDDPQVIIQALIAQFNAANEPTLVDDAQTWFNQGNQQYGAGDLAGAITSWDKALEINPDYQEAWHNRGVALNNLGRSEEAITSFDKAQEINNHKNSA